MSRSLPIRPAQFVAVVAVAIVCFAGTTAVGQSSPRLKGRSLQDALRILQQEGLRIVFSSEAVTADMRVLEEPRGHNRRAQLDELLKPHGLKAVSGPGPIIQIVANRAASRRDDGKSRGAPPSSPPRDPGGRAYSEAVLVRATSEDIESTGSTVALDMTRLQ